MIDGVPVLGMSAPALVGLAVVLLLTGRIVPLSTYREKCKEAERWREAYEAEREARATSDGQTVELLEIAKTTHSIIAAMFGTSSRIRQSREGRFNEPSQT